MLVGADIGGTFTDFVWWTGSELRTYKISTTPANPEVGMLDGIEAMHANLPDVLTVHGSTIATNAFLERKGARAVLVTTAGFGDVLEIGRQTRIGIYDPHTRTPIPLIPAARRIEVAERIDAEGQVVLSLSGEEIERVAQLVATEKPDAIAISLLHAYVNPIHEHLLAARLRQVCPFVYVSSEIDPTYREYERTSTTVFNAYVGPLVASYVERLRGRLQGTLRLVGSDGGRQPSSELARPASMILSGPAGGVIGAHAVAQAAGERDIITLDMGGTSTDVALLPGKILTTRDAQMDGLPLRVPMLDIHTVGAGGGSIARFDRGGALLVGPESAGATPGPACYGRGGESMTVTDAHVVLGHILPDYFLGGRMALDFPAAERVAKRLADGYDGDSVRLAHGVIAVADAAMERAVRTVSARRGYDPEGFVLFCFGGAGGLHAVSLARALGMRGVLVPRHAGVLSALGMVLADTLSTAHESILADLATLTAEEVEARFDALTQRCAADVQAEGFARDELVVEPSLDVRYRGQSYELSVAWQGTPEATAEAFHYEHEQRFGYSDRRAPVEAVNISVVVRAPNLAVQLPELPAAEPAPPRRTVQAWFDGERYATDVYALEDLARDQWVDGPAILAGPFSTVLLPPRVAARVDQYGNVHVPLTGQKEARR